jgi:hypothetical protein
MEAMSEFHGLQIGLFLRDADVDKAVLSVTPARGGHEAFPSIELGAMVVMPGAGCDLARVLRRLADEVDRVVTEAAAALAG